MTRYRTGAEQTADLTRATLARLSRLRDERAFLVEQLEVLARIAAKRKLKDVDHWQLTAAAMAIDAFAASMAGLAATVRQVAAASAESEPWRRRAPERPRVAS
jgi:hypothetical protein